MDLSAELRDRRKAANRTIASVAVDAGLSVPYIANLENGRGNPTVAALDRLATALGARLELSLVDEVPASSGTGTGTGTAPGTAPGTAAGAAFGAASAPAASSADLLAASSRAPRVIADLAATRRTTKRAVQRNLIASLDALGELLPGPPAPADLDRLLDLLLLAAKT